jgi:RIO kinase 1
MQAYIPQTLHGVRDVEAETARVLRGDTAGQAFYAALHGLGEATAPAAAAAAAAGADGASSDSGSGSGSESDEDDDCPDRQPQDRGRAGMSKEEQKLHRAAVKLAKREKRKTKIPKHIKKAHAKK